MNNSFLHMNCIVVFHKDKDGVISHCGEIDFKSLKPREELFNLKCINESGEYEAATWEVVSIGAAYALI